jgi:hypothetical protein
MKRFGFAVVSLTATTLLLGCPLLKKKPADDEDPLAALADAATVTVTGIGAKNEGTVLRYANETPLANIPAIIGSDGATARNFPGNGPTVAFLPKGTLVAKIAQYFSSGVLVMFDDASAGDGSKLIGWVPIKAFDLAAPPPTKTIIVPPPVVVKKDAGSPSVQPQDAGGGGGGNTTVVDAGGGGGGLPQPPKGVPAVAPVNGKCPDGFPLTEGMCRRKCATDADCGRGIKCQQKGGNKVCSSG